MLDEGIGALTLLLPVALVGGCVFCSATVLGCRLVVEQTSSRQQIFWLLIIEKTRRKVSLRPSLNMFAQ